MRQNSDLPFPSSSLKWEVLRRELVQLVDQVKAWEVLEELQPDSGVGEQEMLRQNLMNWAERLLEAADSEKAL